MLDKEIIDREKKKAEFEEKEGLMDKEMMADMELTKHKISKKQRL